MTFLEARQIVSAFQRGDPLPFLLAMSGTADPLDLFVRAAAAKRGRAAEMRALPFNTLGQALRAAPRPEEREVFLLLPWDFAPEADWRSGIPTNPPSAAELRRGAQRTADLLRARCAGRVLYVPAPLPPMLSDPAENASLAHWLLSLAWSLNARVLPRDAFSLGIYLAAGCPIGGAWLGRIAEAVIGLALSEVAASSKVLVTDLDNVLWGGVIAEDGMEGIAFAPEGGGYRHFIFQSLLARLKREGVLLCAVSRNDVEVATEPLRSGRMLLGENDFVAVLASYHAKSAQIKHLANQLNLGLDSFVFVDDNPVELTEVSLALPDVRCVRFPQHDDELARFLDDLSSLFPRREITSEDRERTEMYRRRLEGMVPSDRHGADLTRFLQDLKMTLTIHDRACGERARAMQLITKTNQFNLNGSRLTDAEVGAILDAGGRLFGATLADRTGNHGEVLACLVAPDSTIRSFVMSCRVFQRRVEYAFLAWLAARSSPPIGMHWAKTPRNAAFQQFLCDVAGQPDGNGLVHLDPAILRARYARDLELFTVSEG